MDALTLDGLIVMGGFALVLVAVVLLIGRALGSLWE
jgi:hypothetical protein